MLVAMLAVLSVAVTQPSAPAAAPPPERKARSVQNDIVCRVEPPVGSHIPQRYCASRFYWEQRERQDQEGLHPIGKGGGGGAGAGGGLGGGGPGH